ncbi:extracellular solute-binding protein [Curtobacterium sp. A7_M15]|uniref:ABC transporter substrate-binding protein n=1 Tax=Curtobacterium sp. A7_M15 TaxID=3065241 RepID=UPI002737D528|nr:extracellular solute-binding protein [Curtobacterium sp. A7_M15]MDP4331956.1 extracellular solute-binding protein [Curtobacterium sp. A7_M15]
MFRSLARSRRLAVVGGVAIVAALGLAGCSGSGSATNASSGGSGPTVSVWSWRSQDKPLWNTVQKDLRAQGTDLTIKFRSISATSYDAVLKTAMNGGNGPDIFYDRAGNGTQTYASAGLVAPVDSFIDTKNFQSASLAAAQYKGKTYGVPFAVQTMSMFYNKDLLSKAGIKKPTTWNGLIAAMKKLKAQGTTPMYMMGVQQWLLALQLEAIGASTVDDSTAKAITAKTQSYTTSQYVKSLKAFKQLEPYLEDNWQATGSAGNEQQTAFALGKTAFIIDGIFDTATIDQVNPKLNYGQMLVPSPTGAKSKIASYVDGNISMNAKISDNATKKAAEKVIAFSGTKAFGNAFSSVAGEISPIGGVTIPKKYPLSVQAAHWYQNDAITPTIGIRSAMDTPSPDPTSLKKKSSPSSDTGIFTAEQNVAVPLLKGQLTPEQAAEKIDDQLSWYFGGN